MQKVAELEGSRHAPPSNVAGKFDLPRIPPTGGRALAGGKQGQNLLHRLSLPHTSFHLQPYQPVQLNRILKRDFFSHRFHKSKN